MDMDLLGMAAPMLRGQVIGAVVTFSFYASAIIAVYGVFAGPHPPRICLVRCVFASCGIGILIFCKYVIQ
ncbi:hypothetical protein BHQ17_19360 [Mycolicibacterium holsaticum]|uniref:Uncharacterized protein n=1 Tax=Mycolicibacterium holsaticum TaxID=152142 RepID=A0A1E3RAT2_9MYCO|nr:hypothetical protein [Mycolicibacterium holsaticum DSM 44478 = JCM 12374]ODQ87050.1 hypothetical protein BHQ17_19360 [Mycolicibacterium holsaticum]